MPNSSVGRHDFFQQVTSTDAFVKYDFTDLSENLKFVSNGQLIHNIGANGAEISYDGVNVHGRLAAGAQLSFVQRRNDAIWVKSEVSSSATTVRVYAW